MYIVLAIQIVAIVYLGRNCIGYFICLVVLFAVRCRNGRCAQLQ